MAWGPLPVFELINDTTHHLQASHEPVKNTHACLLIKQRSLRQSQTWCNLHNVSDATPSCFVYHRECNEGSVTKVYTFLTLFPPLLSSPIKKLLYSFASDFFGVHEIT